VTSARQWEANRENAQKSTGPRTEEGKRRSRRNALRHGLTAETVVEDVEDTEDYRAFEATIIADYDARTAVERELVLRLASLLWRIRRATGIETDLLRIQADILRERQENRGPMQPGPATNLSPLPFRNLAASIRPILHPEDQHSPAPSTEADDEPEGPTDVSVEVPRALTHSFLRLANLDNCIFERLGRYEASLWRQFVQTLFALDLLRRQARRFRFLP
jgi:hypothetical protein